MPAPNVDWDEWEGFDPLNTNIPLSETEQARVDRLMASIHRPIAAGDPRRHHYYPQSFLKRFGNDNAIGRVPIAEPHSHAVLRVSDAAVMKDLYTTIDKTVGETVAVEKVLAEVDGAAVQPLDRLAHGVLFPPQQRDREALAIWLGMLHVRTPAQRRHMEAMADQAIKLQLSLVQDEASAHRFLEDWHGQTATDSEARELLDSMDKLEGTELVPHQNEFVMQMLDLGLRASTLFIARHWAVVKCPANGPGLALSDSPFRLIEHPENHRPLMGVGLATADEIWIPLDRHTLLIMHSNPGTGDRVIHLDSDDDISALNQTIVDTARVEVFCHPDDSDNVATLTFQDPDRPFGRVSAGWPIASTDGMNGTVNRQRHHRYRREAPPDPAES
ncbi:MAG: DUF4238 domain-containing protein [Ilumatobacter sp.]|uniref:DUF4238 domain-containing protein n=1 Tax=Ilumatobacter sp. TaxID=1967498 RepID=UPI00391B610C